MKRFVGGVDREQGTLFPEQLEDYVAEDNLVWVIDVFVDKLDLGGLGYGGVEPRATGRPAYHPSVLLKLYIYGYLTPDQTETCKVNSRWLRVRDLNLQTHWQDQ